MQGAKHEHELKRQIVLTSFDNGCLKIGKQIMEAPCTDKAEISPGKSECV